MEREATIQDELKDAVERVAKKFKFDGLEIIKVERDYPIQSKEVKRAREVDLVLFTRGLTPFMFIETKKKGKNEFGLFSDLLDISSVGQVSSYAAIYKRSKELVVPFIATANSESIAVFKTPADIDEYVNWEAVKRRDYKNVLDSHKYYLLKKCLVWHEKLVLDDEYIYHFLSQLARRKETRARLTEALIARLKEFVDRVAGKLSPRLRREIMREPTKSELERLGYKLEPENLPQIADNVARMMAYVFMNKIIFYKLLERFYHLPPLKFFKDESLAKFKEDIDYYFKNAIEKTKDFEPIFIAGVYDLLPLPDDRYLMEYINDFIATLDEVNIPEIGEQIGYIYEELIPPEERHQLGQFYTPPWVCELIVKWCIRSPNDLIFDPGVGSGGFLLKAYEELARQKIGERTAGFLPEHIHERVLEQLYAVDINPFPAHLAAAALAMKNVKALSTKMNVLPADFFSLNPEQEVLAPYTVKTIVGDIPRKFSIPKMDAVVGNPPYTRWIEIPTETQKRVKYRLKPLIKEYGLTPQVSRGLQPGIYVYWIMHATNFLKEGGRLGMIISNTWLQTTYGIRFANFLLDHFRIKAIIDFAARLFKDAVISTCIVLAERESEEKKRLENDVAFIHISGEVESADVDKLLEAVEIGKSEEYSVNVVKQGELPRDRKWIEMFFKAMDISSHPLIAKLGDYFEPSGGNTTYSLLISIKTGQVRGPGASEFLYLSPSRIKEYRLDKWSYPNISLENALVYPAITSARQVNFFTFTKEDWEEMRKSDDRCYMFTCHRPRKELPKEVTDYIKWGETECKTMVRRTRKGGRFASETEGARLRAREKGRFYGWYDLGKVVPAPIFAIYQARYKTRFVWCKFPVATYHALIALIPKGDISLNEVQTKALLAYLNSSFTQYEIERRGRYIPKGPISLEVGMARELPLLDVRKLSDEQLSLLAKLFDELEQEARRIGGHQKEENIEKLKPKIYEIDRAIAELLDLKDADVRNVQAQVDLMIKRRVSAST